MGISWKQIFKKGKKPIISFCQNDYICEHFGYTAFLHRGYYGQETKIIIIVRDCGNRGGGGASGAFRAANARRKQKSVTHKSQYACGGRRRGWGRGRGKDGHCWTREEAWRTSEEDEASPNRGLLGGSRTNRLTILVMFFQWKKRNSHSSRWLNFLGNYTPISLLIPLILARNGGRI